MNSTREKKAMTSQQVDRCLVLALAALLLSGRAVGQQLESPAKNVGERPGERVRERTEERPPERNEKTRPPIKPENDPYRRGERPLPTFPGGFGPGDRDPNLPPPLPRDGVHMRERGPHSPQDLKTFDPEMYELETKDQELERQTQEMSQQLRRAPRDQREALKKQLHELVQKHFDARQARRELQLKRLQEELERMRDGMKKRVEVRDQIIGRRVAELAGEQNDFDF
jgi:hypothetical protein